MFNYNPSGTSSFSPSWGDSTSYNPSSGILKGAGGSVAFPLGAALGAGASVFSGFMQGQAANNQARAMFEAAKMQAQAAERAGFQNLLAGQYALTGGKQFEQGLQRDAANYQQAFLDPRKSVLTAEDLTRRSAAELGSFGQRLRQQSNRDEIQRTLAGKYNGAFGQVYQNPFMFGQTPGYAAGSLV
jgi:hypothetical protein